MFCFQKYLYLPQGDMNSHLMWKYIVLMLLIILNMALSSLLIVFNNYNEIPSKRIALKYGKFMIYSSGMGIG